MRSYRGSYYIRKNEVIESSDLKIISSMLENDLVRVAANPETWETLYFNEKDKSYWLLSYEYPEIQGGGIKVLTEINMTKADDFKQKYS